jgi:CubicO group peptidase (beta-lactamase class C family)
MSQTEELGGSAKVSNQAVGYGPANHGKWPKAAVHNGPSMYAAAGIVSSAQDMATYMTALMSGDLLTPATYASMWTSTPTPQYNVKPSSNAMRGPGWDTVIDASTGPVEVEKGGQVPGYTSELVLFPNTDSGVFVSYNSLNPHGISALQVADAVYAAAEN